MSNNILAEIVANKEQELILRKQRLSIDDLKNNLTNSKRSFFDALNSEKSDFIFECKKASPSKGLIRKNFDLPEILAVYKDFASAISVLTDYTYFKGSFEFLAKASQTVSQPVLCKDFFIDIYQVYEARHFGADAILLMLSVLDDAQYIKLADVARQLDLDVLTEVHDNEELQRAIKLKARIIGINNRNLKDLSIDLATTESLVSQIPDDIRRDTLIVSESGISNRQQIKRLAPLVNGFLIGSSIMAEENVRKQCKKLIYGTTKICGLTSENSAKTAFEQGAIYGGLIFYSKSPRCVDLEQAKAITKAAPLDYVGVFVNEDEQTLIYTATKLALKVIQLHGDETREYIKNIKEALPQCDIWKAISIKVDSTTKPSLFEADSNIDRYLLDTHNGQMRGGSGQSFDWSLLERIDKQKVMLAGGINIDNVESASKLNTFGLDINSGVEDSPGIKSEIKITTIFEALRA
jgi:indole-3-glycerol phosphate synthase/phosphoribosylanthranilate isomerase